MTNHKGQKITKGANQRTRLSTSSEPLKTITETGILLSPIISPGQSRTSPQSASTASEVSSLGTPMKSGPISSVQSPTIVTSGSLPVVEGQTGSPKL